MSNPSEKRFETHIEQSLNEQGYSSIQFNEYDRTLCLIPNEVIGFVVRDLYCLARLIQSQSALKTIEFRRTVGKTESTNTTRHRILTKIKLF